MDFIRKAMTGDERRIAEILVFNYRMSFYPIFRNDDFYFGEMTVDRMERQIIDEIDTYWVYDDGVVKGFVQIRGNEICRLFVEPVLQNQGIGTALIRFAIGEEDAKTLWALEKNTAAIRFYRRHGFVITQDCRKEEGTEEYLVRLEKCR